LAVSGLRAVRRFEFMNIIRAKIVVFWLSFLLFCLLLCFSWRHRLLWLALFGATCVVIGFIKPRLPFPPPKIRFLFGLALFVFLFAFIVHGFLFPHSAGLYLLMKILCPLFTLPALCYKAYADYVLFRSSHSGNAWHRAGASDRHTSFFSASADWPCWENAGHKLKFLLNKGLWAKHSQPFFFCLFSNPIPYPLCVNQRNLRHQPPPFCPRCFLAPHWFALRIKAWGRAKAIHGGWARPNKTKTRGLEARNLCNLWLIKFQSKVLVPRGENLKKFLLL